jgi:hypothetical protein
VAKRQAKLHVLFYQSAVEHRWAAHLLEYDLVGTGEGTEDALEEVLGMFEAQLECLLELGKKAAPVHKAPQEYWTALKEAVNLGARHIKLGEYAQKASRRRAARFPPISDTVQQALLPDRHLIPA